MQQADEVVLPNNYRIEFLEVEDNEDASPPGTILSASRPMLRTLATGSWKCRLLCIVTAAPEPWEAVCPDPNAHLDGIKWQTGMLGYMIRL